MSIPAPPKLAKPGQKIEVPLELVRRFGFAEVVYAALVPPPNVSGMHANELTIQAGQTKGTLIVELDPQIKPGEYKAIVRARMNFNGQSSQLDQPVVINVEPPEKKEVPESKKEKK